MNERREALIATWAEKGGFRGRINAKCIECVYDPHQAGTWRQQVENCTSPACPLHPIRPTSTTEAGDEQ